MLNAIFFYRMSRWCYLHHIPVIPTLITLLIFLIYNSKVPPEAAIGRGTRLNYGGLGVVIHKRCTIGDNCTIGQQVTLGGGNNRYPGVPRLGNNVYVAKGAAIIGGIDIGDNVTVGINAVVTRPVPANAIVAGVPARVLRFKEPGEK